YASQMMMIAQGAEAELYEDGNTIIKIRKSKSYRVPEIDRKITTQRTKREANILKKLETLKIQAPRLIKVEENALHMTKIEGITAKDAIDASNARDILFKIGEIVAQIHNADIIHGDLTTMNFIVGPEGVFVIDFGLGYSSIKDEDKAVDLYVFERALKCAHSEELVDLFYDGYKTEGKSDVLKRLEQVRLRGRKREESGM
ncbi:TP53 regulating kinase, partial [Enteropsectra breve]